MLQSQARAVDLPFPGGTTQLPHEFGALSQTGRTERVTLGEQAARRVGDNASAIGVVAVENELLGGALEVSQVPRR